MRFPTALLCAALGACATTTPSKEAPAVKNLTPHQDVPFSRGPGLGEGAALSEWLAAQQQRGAVVRLPVTVTLDALAGVAEAKLGGLPVQLDDGRLGVSLSDRLRSACEVPGTCVVWLEGNWTAGEAAATLRLTRFVRAAKDGEAAEYVESAD